MKEFYCLNGDFYYEKDGDGKVIRGGEDMMSGESYTTKDKHGNKVIKQKLYFGAEKTHVSIEDIKCSVSNNIEKYTKWINEYVSVINSFLNENYKIDIDRCIFDIKREYGEHLAYEDDGYTACEGFNYHVLWAFPLGNSISDEWNIRQGYSQEYLYFTYKAEERLHDNKEIRSRFFTIYLAGIKLPREDNHVTRIDYNNDNMALNSILNKGNMVSIILKIRELQKTSELVNEIEKIELFAE